MPTIDISFVVYFYFPINTNFHVVSFTSTQEIFLIFCKNRSPMLNYELLCEFFYFILFCECVHRKYNFILNNPFNYFS